MTEGRMVSFRRSIERPGRWPLCLVMVVAVAYVAHAVFDAMTVVPKRTDFPYFWIAGETWSRGGSPYSPMFGVVRRSLAGVRIEDMWIYPPSWYPICRALAAFPMAVAAKVWTALILLSFAGSILCWRAYRAVGGPLNPFWFTLLFVATVAGEPAFRSVRNGQTGTFILLGVGLLLFGALRRNMVCAVLGAWLVMLKPTFGIPLCAAAILMPGMWRPVVVAGAVTIASMIPAFLVETPAEMIGGIARNIDLYRGYRFNSAAGLPGFFHLVERIAGYRPSVAVLLSASVAPILAAFLCLRRHGAPREDTIVSLFVVGIASAAFFTLPHRYDLVCVYALAIVVWHFRPWLAVGLCALPVVAFRTFDVNILSLAAGITWCAAMATALPPRAYAVRLPLGRQVSDGAIPAR